MGEAGQRTRGWIGLRDQPLTAWAGVCIDDRCAGVLVLANEWARPLNRMMPRLLTPEDQNRWLGGGTLLSLGPCCPDADFYFEDLGERWSSGRSEEDTLPLFSVAA